MGDSKKRLKEFPSETQRAMGGALMLAQLGGLADHAKPFHGVGSGVFEIAERQDKNAYRFRHGNFDSPRSRNRAKA